MIEKRIAMGSFKFLLALKEGSPYLAIHGRETTESSCVAMYVIKMNVGAKREKYFHLVVNFSRV